MLVTQHRSMCFGILIIILVTVTLLGIIDDRPSIDQKQSASKPTGAQASPPTRMTDQPVAYTLPGGGDKLLPTHRFVALYGSPGIASMGVLGEHSMAENIQRVKYVASEYQKLTKEYVWPTFEIIATVASSSPTVNGDYSREIELSELRPWVAEAKKAGIYVLLDLQPGRTDFLTQAKQYEELLKEPHVGLALDPEWRLKADQVHLKQIGSVDAAEINAVGDWLADIVRRNHLPQKLLLLHQFRVSMITQRQQLNTTHKELAYIIQMDGHGVHSTKLDTWNVIRQDAPSGISFGWKNFFSEDKPMFTPEETMALTPQPWFVSFQ